QPCAPRSSKPRGAGLPGSIARSKSALSGMGPGCEQNGPDRFCNCGDVMRHKPSDYRLMAAMCLEIANQMSLDTDRTRVTDVAQRGLGAQHTSEAENRPAPAQQPRGHAARGPGGQAPSARRPPPAEASPRNSAPAVAARRPMGYLVDGPRP